MAKEINLQLCGSILLVLCSLSKSGMLAFAAGSGWSCPPALCGAPGQKKGYQCQLESKMLEKGEDERTGAN